MINPLPVRLLAFLLLCAGNVFSNPITTENYRQPFTEIKMLSTFLYAANGNMADGNRCVFASQYSNDVDRYDAVKMTNPGENFGLLRQGYTLAVEARQPISAGDTLHYKMSNLAAQTYTLSIQVQYLTETVSMAEFVDRFTNTRRLISMSNTTSFPVTVTNDPASKAANRFYLVFLNPSAIGAVLPVKFAHVQVQRNSAQKNIVQWKVEEELNVAHYEVERSDDGTHFKYAGKVAVSNVQSVKKDYSFMDDYNSSSTVFYRIKSIDLDGKQGFSKIVSVQNLSVSASISTYPNPANTPQLNVRLKAATAGDYRVSISSVSGQQLYNKSFTVRTAEQVLQVPVSQLSNGHYVLSVTGADGKAMVQSIMVKK